MKPGREAGLFQNMETLAFGLVEVIFITVGRVSEVLEAMDHIAAFIAIGTLAGVVVYNGVKRVRRAK